MTVAVRGYFSTKCGKNWGAYKMKGIKVSLAIAVIGAVVGCSTSRVVGAPSPPSPCQNDIACMRKHFPHGVLRAPMAAPIPDKDIDKHICAKLSKSDRVILRATMLHLMPMNRANVAVVLADGRVLSNHCGKPPVEVCKFVKGTRNTVRCPGGRPFPAPE